MMESTIQKQPTFFVGTSGWIYDHWKGSFYPVDLPRKRWFDYYRVSSRELGVPEHAVVKTLVMEDDTGAPLVVLMHGDREVSTKALARRIGRKSVRPCPPASAQRHSGYQVGGTSPFGTRHAMPVFIEGSIFDLPRVWSIGGSRGFLVGIDPREIVRVLDVTIVEVAIAKS